MTVQPRREPLAPLFAVFTEKLKLSSCNSLHASHLTRLYYNNFHIKSIDIMYNVFNIKLYIFYKMLELIYTIYYIAIISKINTFT